MIPFTPDTVIFTIGTYRLGTELFFKIVALAIFIPLTSYILKKKKIFTRTIESFLFVTIVLFSAYLGGRLWTFIQLWHGPRTILDFFNLNNTGTTSFGFFIGATVAVLIYLYKRNPKNAAHNTK